MALHVGNELFSPPGYYYSDKVNEFHENRIQLLEFDGATVLCRVCGDKASGFHYGVHSCEGCKGFFRRSIQQKIQYRPCSKNQQCSILRVNRNRCQYCRLKKCITVGMSRDAVRFGRVPKREKAKIMAAMQASHIIKTNETILNEELTNTAELKMTIINAHFKTCEFTRNKIDQLIKSALVETSSTELKTEGGIVSATLSYLTCPLNPKNYASPEDNLDDNFSDRFSPAIRGVVEFAKLLPGFNILTQDDQIILLKNGVFEVLLLRLSNMFLNDKMICINGKVVNINNIDDDTPTSGPSTSSAKFLIKSMFNFTNEFNQWNLNDNIIGIFSSIVIMSWDRPGLQNPDMVKKIQSCYRHVLHTLLPAELCNTLESKIPDLRALNTLHSAKLLSFKMGDGNSDGKKFEENITTDDDDISMETEELPSTNQPMIQHCPFNNTNSLLTHFPVSPSNDSGIDSGSGSSPSRSETFETPMYNTPEETMPVLKRALLAPPMIDNQYVSNYYDGFEGLQHGMGFDRRGSTDSEYNVVGHKKFRRRTLTPPATDMSRTRTPSPQRQPSPQPNFSMFNSKPEVVTMNEIDKIPKTPVQLYPQLASALTRPICTNVPEMSTLKQSLLKPPMTSSHAETSDYIHSLIMRNEFGTGSSLTPPTKASPPAPVAAQITKKLLSSVYETNQIPLNLCMKSALSGSGLT